MRNQTERTVLDALFIVVAEIAAAFFSQSIKRAKTEKTVKVLSLYPLMTRKIFAFAVLIKIMTHRHIIHQHHPFDNNENQIYFQLLKPGFIKSLL